MRGLWIVGFLGFFVVPSGGSLPLFEAESPDPAQEFAFYGLATPGSVDNSWEWPEEHPPVPVPVLCLPFETSYLVTLHLMTGAESDALRLRVPPWFTPSEAVATMGQPVTLESVDPNGGLWCGPVIFTVVGESVASVALYRVDVDCTATTELDLVPDFC